MACATGASHVLNRSTALDEHYQLVAEMLRALEQDEFRVHLQPKIELATGRIAAVEALVRWQHPEAGSFTHCDSFQQQRKLD